MRFHVRRTRAKPTINIVSLIDILCILLIFLVVTTVFRSDEPVIKINVPESSQGKPTQEELPTIIYVAKDEKIFLGDKPVPIHQLGGILKNRLSERPGAKFAMRADKEVPFGTIIKVMDASKIAGIHQLPTFTQDTPPSE